VLILFSQVLDFGAARDGVPKEQRGIRQVVDQYGHETDDNTDSDEANVA
jgi:F-box and WD-40 domain protein CDC4